MKNPENTDFNVGIISGWTKAQFIRWWKLHSFDGDAEDW